MLRQLCVTKYDVEQFFKRNSYSVLALDTETTSLVYTELQIEGISLCNGVETIYVPFIFRKDSVKYWENLNKEDIILLLKSYLKEVKLLIMHNAPFDLKVLHKYDITVECELFDTMVAQHLFNENSEKGLKKIVSQYLNVDVEKYSDICADTGSKKFIDYALNDAEWTYLIAQKQKELLKQDNLMTLFREVEMPFQYVLLEMSINGISIDKSKVSNTYKELIKNKEDVTVQMLETLKEPYQFQLDLFGNSNIITDINFSSSQQLAHILFNKLGLQCIEQTPSGKPAVGKNTLEHYKDNIFVSLLKKYKIIDKLLSSFFEPLPTFIESDGKVRPSFNDCGTVTGRMSCIAKGTKIQTVRDFSKEPKGKNIEDIQEGDYIYCSDSNGALKIRKVKKVINNGNQECIKLRWVSASNKFYGDLVCTPDHKIKMLDDTWKQAQDIIPTSLSEIGRARRLGEELPLDSRVYSLHFQLNDYAYIYYPGMKKIKNIRYLMDAPNSYGVIHHKDGNKLNDTPDNLVFMTHSEHTKLHAQTGRLKDVNIQAKAQDTLRKMRESGLINYNRSKRQFDYDYCLSIAHKNKGMIKYIIQNEKHDYIVIKREMERHNIDLKEIKKLYEDTNHFIVGKENVGYRNVYDLEIECLEGQDTHNFFANEICVHNCSKPNLQQLPKKNEHFPVDTRGCFIAGEGRKMIVSDFSSQEVCVAAELSQDQTLIKSLKSGYDVHLAVANSSFNLGIPEECLSKHHNDYEMYKKKYKNERTNAKTITFGLMYGKEFYGFSLDFNISEEEAQKMIDSFYQGMPKVKESIEKAHKDVLNNGYVTYLSGRKRHFEKVEKNGWSGYTKKSLRQSFNAMIQGTSADMMRMAMIKTYKESKKYPQYGIKIVGTIHDEQIVTCNEKYAKESAQLVKSCMETCVSFSVPIVSDTEIVDNYGDAK